MVAPAAPCHLIGIGATTGVGGTASVSMAAFRAGLTRTERIAHGRDDEAWSHAIRVGTLELRDPEERARALVGSALNQTWLPLKKAASAYRIGAWCAGGAWLAELVARQLGLDTRRVLHAGEHACAGLFALRDAGAALSEKSVDIALVAGVGVESHSLALQRGRERGRVLGGESSFGTVPGEAAVALVWTSERVREQLAIPSLGRLIAVATADERTPFGGPLPCVGNALIEAIRAALSSVPASERIDHVLCDLNGERERADEWGFALPRLNQRLQTPGSFIAPISAFGDVGAPAGLLLVALASAACKGTRAPARSVIWTSSPGSPRAAALFEAPAANAAPIGSSPVARPPAIDAEAGAPLAEPASPPVPSWALALDTSVLDELVDEGAFRYDQRLYEYDKASSGAADAPRPALTRIETSLDQIIRGLVECGPRAWRRAEEALAQPTARAVYTVLRVLFEAKRPQRALPIILEHAGATLAHGQAAHLALAHAGADVASVGPVIDACLGSGTVIATIGLRLSVQSGTRISGARLSAMSERVPDEVDAAAGWLDALAQLEGTEARACIQRWQFSRHDRLRRCWAQAELCLGGAEGKAIVLARSQEDPAVILPAALAVGGAQVRAFRELATALSGADACLALGILGDVVAVPILVERLGDPIVSDAAACALELLLGAAPAATRMEPDLDPSAPPRQVPCISRDPAEWRALADSILARHRPQTRWRAGMPASVPGTVGLLERLHLPLRVRSYLARELRVRWNVRQRIDLQSLLRQQRSALAAIELPTSAPSAGSWD